MKTKGIAAVVVVLVGLVFAGPAEAKPHKRTHHHRTHHVVHRQQAPEPAPAAPQAPSEPGELIALLTGEGPLTPSEEQAILAEFAEVEAEETATT